MTNKLIKLLKDLIDIGIIWFTHGEQGQTRQHTDNTTIKGRGGVSRGRAKEQEQQRNRETNNN